MSELVCRAIREKKRLTFVYGGKPRVVEPYAHGISTTGAEVLRAVQVGGGGGGFGFGKLWIIAKMETVAMSKESFPASDPNYNPRDSAMKSIHCNV